MKTLALAQGNSSVYRLQRRTLKVALYALLVFVAVMQLFPLIWVASYSLQKSGDLFGGELLRLPLHPQWDNYVRAFRDGKVLQYSLNSLLVVSISTLISTASTLVQPSAEITVRRAV